MSPIELENLISEYNTYYNQGQISKEELVEFVESLSQAQFKKIEAFFDNLPKLDKTLGSCMLLYKELDAFAGLPPINDSILFKALEFELAAIDPRMLPSTPLFSFSLLIIGLIIGLYFYLNRKPNQSSTPTPTTNQPSTTNNNMKKTNINPIPAKA